MRRRPWLPSSLAALAVLAPACVAGPAADEYDDDDNPFLEVPYREGKEDTAYMNPDGVEVEVDLEAEVEAPSYQRRNAPAALGQFVSTYLRLRGQFYLESLAEIATSGDRVEWLVGDEWIPAAEVGSVPAEQLRRFRIRGMNAIMLFPAGRSAQLGQVFEAEVPVRPFAVMSEGGDRCANPDGHMTLSQSIYWYLWNPDRPNCDVDTQTARVTVSRLFQASEPTYPEYDRLIEDGRVTAVVLFGLIGDEMSESDSGFRAMERMAQNLAGAGFEEVPNPPLGRRFRKVVAGVELLYDLYSPREFSGLGDFGNFSNFQRAVSEHEIVAYDGHSMLGASDFWSRPTYPDFYQVYLYGGCLGYQYYVQPIVEGKGGWDNVDIVSSVVEVSADANRYAAPFLARLEWALQNDYAASWPDMLQVIRRNVGDSTFGASGVMGNCFTPTGSRCGGGGGTGEARRYESDGAVEIPDDQPAGVTSVIEVPDQLTLSGLTVEVDIAHTYVGDLRVVLEHGGVETVLWDRAGGSSDDIRQSFPASAFAGTQAAGPWRLTVSDHAGQDVGTLAGWALVIAE